LARSNVVWVIATFRSDLLPLVEESAELSRLAGDDRRYALRPPTRTELREIIECPAAMVGLNLTGVDRSGVPLTDILVEATASNTGSLPLLQFALARLYEDAGRTGQISYEAYDRIGRIEGAIGRWAEDVVARLGDTAEVARVVDDVLLALARVDRNSGTALVRTAELDSDFATPAHRRMVEALKWARLVVQDVGKDHKGRETATVRVAHEALLSHWPRARQAIELHADALDLRDRLHDAGTRWIARGRDDSYLLRTKNG
jgi:hypothetical protein